MKVKFISRDGLSLETEVPIVIPSPRIARAMYPKLDARLAEATNPVPIGVRYEERFYDYVGFRNGVATYKEQ